MTSYKDVLAGGASLAPSPNNALVTLPFTGGVQRPLGDKVFETVSVKDFGVKGDGTTDDTAAIKTAILAQIPLYWPAGTYRITGDIGAGSIIHSAADLFWIGHNAKILLDSMTPINWMLRILNVSQSVFIDGVSFDAASMSTQCLRIESNTASMADANTGSVVINNASFKRARRTEGMDGAGALLIRGGYKLIDLDRVTCYNCSIASGAGVSGSVGQAGILISHFGANAYAKDIKINRAFIDKIWSEDSTYVSDQDGINILAPAYADATEFLEKSLSIMNSTFRNCWGRSIKAVSNFVNASNLVFYRDEGFTRGYGNDEIGAQRGGGHFRGLRCYYNGHVPVCVVGLSYEEPLGDPLIVPPLWGSTIEDVQIYIRDSTQMFYGARVFPRDGYCGPVSLKRVDVHGGPVRALVQMSVNGDDNDLFVEQCSAETLTADFTTSNRAFIRVVGEGTDTPYAARVTARDNIYRGAETAYVAEGAGSSGAAAAITVTAENNRVFAGNTPP